MAQTHKRWSRATNPKILHKGFPKTLPCLVCDRPRVAKHAGDRIHAGCKRSGVADMEVRSGMASQSGSVDGDQ